MRLNPIPTSLDGDGECSGVALYHGSRTVAVVDYSHCECVSARRGRMVELDPPTRRPRWSHSAQPRRQLWPLPEGLLTGDHDEVALVVGRHRGHASGGTGRGRLERWAVRGFASRAGRHRHESRPADYAATRRHAGVDVDLFVAPDMPHAFFAFDCGITRQWFEHQASWIEARL
jgi:acetyl esterase/lipase